MWKRLKPYLKFCGLALRDDFKHWGWYRKMSTTYVRLDKLIATLFGGGLLSLVIVYVIIPGRDELWNNLLWVARIALAAFVLLLLYLIGAVKRFHDRTVSALNEEHDRTVEGLNATHASEISDRERHADRISRLNYVLGMAQGARQLNIGAKPLPKEFLEYLNGQIDGTLYYCFGAEFRDEYFKIVGPVPDSADDQPRWIYHTRERLDEYVKHQQTRLDALKPKPKRKQLPPA